MPGAWAHAESLAGPVLRRGPDKRKRATFGRRSVADVFISYSRSDREYAEALAGILQKRGLAVWWDVELLPADRFPQRIVEEIESAHAVVVLWSKASVDSTWVTDEAAIGLKSKKLIQASIDGALPPPGFGIATTQIADLSSWSPDTPAGFSQKLLEAIERLVPSHKGVDALKERLAQLEGETATLAGELGRVQRLKLPLLALAATSLALLGVLGILLARPSPPAMATPPGAVLAFEAERCPGGWSAYAPAFGRFVRGIDPGVEADRRRKPGSLEDDALQDHVHEIAGAKTAGHQPQVGAPHGYDAGALGNTINETKFVRSAKVGDETRPKNVALLYCLKD